MELKTSMTIRPGNPTDEARFEKLVHLGCNFELSSRYERRKLLKFYFQSFLLGVPVCLTISSHRHTTYESFSITGNSRRLSHATRPHLDSSVLQNDTDSSHGPRETRCMGSQCVPILGSTVFRVLARSHLTTAHLISQSNCSRNRK